MQLSLALSGGLWLWMHHRLVGLRRNRTIEIPLPQTQGLSLHGAAGLRIDGDKIIAFSTRCSHLGCRVRLDDADGVVCPCHGSRFDPKGQPIAGPARQPLATLGHTVDMENGRIIVELDR